MTQSAGTIRPTHPYVAAASGAGLLVIADSLVQIVQHPPGLEWFVLAALTLLSGSFTVKLPALPARLSVSETFVFTSVLLFGPAAGTLTVVLDALVISFWMASANREPSKLLFNATAPAVAIRIASEAFFWISGAHPGAITRAQIGHLIVPVFAFALIYFFINASLVAGALATETGDKISAIWLRNFPSVSVNYFVGSSIAMLIVAYTDRIDLTVLGIIVPLLVISYLTFRSSLGRLEDANRHIAQIHELYLSTIETLAMAVDAKDQITHGHIRRVQVYATELAKRLGVSDDAQLKAIEAAALLHDMGKLAIPEHILNKPGRLSDAEFSVIKHHADIGADLLSQVRFPYPVVPIVRHHHENWNGTGYPARIGGTDIPLGARILSVVDCFDALTSDRPYRPKVTPEQAFEILEERRGTMYDPLVVDTFVSVYADIAPIAIRAGAAAPSVIPKFVIHHEQPVPGGHLAADARSMAELRQTLYSVGSLDEALSSILERARQYAHVTALVIYAPVPNTDFLVSVAAAAPQGNRLCGISIKRGERIVGWAAATHETIANSDARLDLGPLAEAVSPPLQLAICSPVFTSGGTEIGVLAGYSSDHYLCSQQDQHAFERLAAAAADPLSALLHVSAP